MAETLPDQVQLGLLGSFSLQVDDRPVDLPLNSQRLVAFLALNEGSLLRQHVAGVLWGDTTDRHAGGSLRTALWRLGHPQRPLVEAVGAHLQLSAGVNVDVHASEELAHNVLDGSRDPVEAELQTLLSSDILPDWSEDWVLVRREHHTQLRLRALETSCRRLTASGRYGEAVQAGMLAVSAEPLRESAQRALIAAHIAEGNIAAAMAQYQSFREVLHEELHLEPSAEMSALVEEFKR